jgi:hypothetical protein
MDMDLFAPLIPVEGAASKTWVLRMEYSIFDIFRLGAATRTVCC